MNWRNVAENLGIALIGVLFGAILTYFTITESNKVMVAQLRPVIEQAIAKETTSIKNDFKTEIKKLKSKGGSNIDLTVSPDVDNESQTVIKADSVPKKRKTLLGRIFTKKDN